MKKEIIVIMVSAFMAVSSVTAKAAQTDSYGMETQVDEDEVESKISYCKYRDVTDDKWYYGAAEYVSDKSIMNGTSSGVFSPDLYLTRGMLAQIIKNMDGRSDKIYWSYLDVKEDAWYADSVAWCSDAGVMKGYGDGRFGPEDYITREQLVFTLYRYAVYKEFPNLDTTGIQLLSYTDYKDVSGYAGGAMQWALINGLLSGKDGKMLDPKGYATRAEVAQVVKNFMIFYNM